MDDFNHRLKILERSSINNQRRESVTERKNNRINYFNDDLRF
jgi:hypothetical protein